MEEITMANQTNTQKSKNDFWSILISAIIVGIAWGSFTSKGCSSGSSYVETNKQYHMTSGAVGFTSKDSLEKFNDLLPFALHVDLKVARVYRKFRFSALARSDVMKTLKPDEASYGMHRLRIGHALNVKLRDFIAGNGAGVFHVHGDL